MKKDLELTIDRETVGGGMPTIKVVESVASHDLDKPFGGIPYFEREPIYVSLAPTWSSEEWFAARCVEAIRMLEDCVEVDPLVRGGTPVLRGTRIPVARAIADIADGYTIVEVAGDFEIDVGLLKRFFDGMASYLDRPISR